MEMKKGGAEKAPKSKGVSELFTPYSRPFHALLPLYLVEGFRKSHMDHKMFGSVLRSKVTIDNSLTFHALGLMKSETGSIEFFKTILNSQAQGFCRLMNFGPLGDTATCAVTGIA
jgi:hypothetical protein